MNRKPEKRQSRDGKLEQSAFLDTPAIGLQRTETVSKRAEKDAAFSLLLSAEPPVLANRASCTCGSRPSPPPMSNNH